MIQFPKPTVEQFFRTYTITDFAVSKDEERLIFSTNLNGKMNLWAMDLPDTYPYLFSHREESCSFLKIDDKNRYVLAGFDRDGDENHQIYALPFDGGLPQDLVTGESDEKYFYAKLSDDGERLYYMTSKDNPSFMNTRMRHLYDGADTLVHQGEKSPTFLTAISKDEKVFVFIQMFANTYIKGMVKVGTETYELVPDSNKIHTVSDPVFIEDTIYFVTNYESEYSYVAKFDLKKKDFSKVLSIEKESIISLNHHKDPHTFYVTTEHGVHDALYRYDLAAGLTETVDIPADVIGKIHVADSGALYMLATSGTTPINIYYSETGTDWKQLTNNNVLGVRNEDMVEPDIVSYTSYDGLELEALLFKALPGNDNGHTIFWPHGGPQAAERKTYRSMFQAFLNRGYTIFAPNFRGSTGYGATFVKLVEQDWGEGPRLDCVAGIEWLFENNISERDKLFLVGGSYGGYMSLLLHGRHADYFKAVVDIFGPSDLFTFANSVPDHWKPIMERWIGDPVRDKERFIKDSPIT